MTRKEKRRERIQDQRIEGIRSTQYHWILLSSLTFAIGVAHLNGASS